VLPHCAESTPRPLREQPMLRFPQAVNSGLDAHSVVQGNHTPWTESVNIAKVRPVQHLWLWELQDVIGCNGMSLEFLGLLQDNQGVFSSSSHSHAGHNYFCDSSR
jgi:hypothetical protein